LSFFGQDSSLLEENVLEAAQIFFNTLEGEEKKNISVEFKHFVNQNKGDRKDSSYVEFANVLAPYWLKNMDVNEVLNQVILIFNGETKIPIDPNKRWRGL